MQEIMFARSIEVIIVLPTTAHKKIPLEPIVTDTKTQKYGVKDNNQYLPVILCM